MGVVRVTISLSKRDKDIIDSYCKNTGRKFSPFVISTAVREIKEEVGETRLTGGFWSVFKK